MQIDGAGRLYSGIPEMRRRIEIIVGYVREVESRLSVHDSIMEAASDGMATLSEINEAIYYAKDALMRLCRINEAMESIGGEVTRLKWEICKQKKRAV
jgi:hypothetical protein